MIGIINGIVYGDEFTTSDGQQNQYLRVHVVFQDTVAVYNTDKLTLLALTNNTPFNEIIKKQKYDIGYYVRTTKNGNKMVMLQYMNKV